MTLEAICRPLAFDSELLGFPVVSLDAQRLDASRLRESLGKLRAERVRLVYWRCDARNDGALGTARRLGGFLADRKITYRRRAAGGPPLASGTEVTAYAGERSTAELDALAIQSGAHSRFRLDPNIPDAKFCALYRTWMAESVAGRMAQAVLVVRHRATIVGMTTVGDAGVDARIGLLSVDRLHRRRGLGRALVAGAWRWAQQARARELRVVTQASNGPACRLYEACGFELERAEDLYHFWL